MKSNDGPTTIATVSTATEPIDARLSERERGTLSACETVIARGQQTFVEVGRALREIRDGRLYRESHRSFEEYLRARWGMARAHGHRSIAAAEVVEAEAGPQSDQ